jgi:hypothetical protein
MFGRKAVQLECAVAHRGGERRSEQLLDGLVIDILIMLARRRLGRWGEDRCRQLLRLLQSRGQRQAADSAAAAIVVPPRADQITAHHRFDRQRTQALHDHRAAFQQPRLGRVGDRAAERQVGQVIGYDVRGAREPELRDLVQHAALARYRIGQHDIECRQPIGGDDQHMIVIQRVQVAHLAAMQARQAGQFGVVDRCFGNRAGARGQGLLPYRAREKGAHLAARAAAGSSTHCLAGARRRRPSR